MTFLEFLADVIKALLNPMTLFLIILTILLIAGIVNWDQIDHLTKGLHL